MIISNRLSGISFITRCHNEQDNIEKAIISLAALKIPYDIVVILHRSNDLSEKIVLNLAETHPITIVKYNRPISRAGYETLITPADHPNSIVTYVNWCFSHARRNWIFRWDADFYASSELIDFLNSLNPDYNYPTVYKIPCNLGDYITAEHYLNNCLYEFKKYKFWEVAKYSHENPTYLVPSNNAVINTVPRSNLKKYWNETAWFQKADNQDKTLCEKMLLLELFAGKQPEGFGACCYKVEEYADLFLKIDTLEQQLKKFYINFYS